MKLVAPPPAVRTPVVEIRDLSKAFAGVRALDRVSLDLCPGEIHALMGENGAGKSTLMKILSGILPRDSGQIRVDGEPVALESPRAAQDLGIGIVHQELNLMNHLSAAQNIFLGREPRRGWLLDERALLDQTQQLFNHMKLRLDPRTPVGELTVARQQMVEIAKALSYRSRVLILDEPTAALNGEEVAELFRILRQLQREGVGIIYISHKMDELAQIAQRVTVMRDGQIVGTCPLPDTPMETLVHMMVGRPLEPFTPPAMGSGEAPMLALEVRHLRRGRVIRDVSFGVRRGEILGLAGLMGAGRTEVARAIFGADPLEAGEVRVHGTPVRIRSPRDAVAHGIGYLSEDRKHFGLATGMDVATNLMLTTLPRHRRHGLFLDDAALREIAQQEVLRLGIKTPSLHQPVRLLSGGNQQKIVLAKWLLCDCDILFVDEPTRGIDVGAKAEIHKLLLALAAQGKAIVVISSELPEVLRLSHRILVMCEGRVTGELPAAEATQDAIMALATQRQPAPAAAHRRNDRSRRPHRRTSALPR